MVTSLVRLSQDVLTSQNGVCVRVLLFCPQGLKKLGHSIETSYSNIQKLVLKHLQAVGQALLYHLNDVRGMATWQEKFADLGLAVDSCACAVDMAASFMLKSSELQQ